MCAAARAPERVLFSLARPPARRSPPRARRVRPPGPSRRGVPRAPARPARRALPLGPAPLCALSLSTAHRIAPRARTTYMDSPPQKRKFSAHMPSRRLGLRQSGTRPKPRRPAPRASHSMSIAPPLKEHGGQPRALSFAFASPQSTPEPAHRERGAAAGVNAGAPPANAPKPPLPEAATAPKPLPEAATAPKPPLAAAHRRTRAGLLLRRWRRRRFHLVVPTRRNLLRRGRKCRCAGSHCRWLAKRRRCRAARTQARGLAERWSRCATHPHR